MTNRERFLAEIDKFAATVVTIQTHLAAGYSVSDLRAGGCSVSDLRAGGCSVSALWRAGYSVRALREYAKTITD
jgi:UDP-N-acetylglucosamine enolpyruvyl transferase